MSFYIFETQYEPVCERCNVNARYIDYELCKPCIHEMIVPGYVAQAVPEDMQKEIRRANGFD